MKVLYIGDIMGEPGIQVVEKCLPSIKDEFEPDVVIAQAENVTEGKGISPTDFKRLQKIGIDFCTGGNWSLFIPEINSFLDDEASPIIRPANYPSGTSGKAYKYLPSNKGHILVISLLGHIVGKDSEKPVDNPLHVVDKILKQEENTKKITTIVNFHGDYSSEKRVIGYYLDGKVGAVIGDHWHVPSADAMLLPKSTAHVSDVGMCGSLDSSLGVKLDVIIDRWRDQRPHRNVLETDGRMQFNAVLVTISEDDGLAKSIERIQKIY